MIISLAGEPCKQCLRLQLCVDDAEHLTLLLKLLNQSVVVKLSCVFKTNTSERLIKCLVVGTDFVYIGSVIEKFLKCGLRGAAENGGTAMVSNK